MFDFDLTPEQEERAREVHERAVVIDMLAESTLPDGLFEDMKQGGLTCGSFTIGAPGTAPFSQRNHSPHDDWWSHDVTVRT